jgi:hypothetical protein
MSHSYPLAATALAALSADAKVARTRYEAEAAADGLVVTSLETEWLTPARDDLETALAQAAQSPAHGFVQNYEDAAGNTVLAVTYWKLAKTKAKAPKAVPKPTDIEADHTDDLYFKRATKKPRKGRPVDPNQLDMFGASVVEDGDGSE